MQAAAILSHGFNGRLAHISAPRPAHVHAYIDGACSCGVAQLCDVCRTVQAIGICDGCALAASQALDAAAKRIVTHVGDSLLLDLATGARAPRRDSMLRAVEFAAARELVARGLCADCGGDGRACGCER